MKLLSTFFILLLTANTAFAFGQKEKESRVTKYPVIEAYQQEHQFYWSELIIISKKRQELMHFEERLVNATQVNSDFFVSVRVVTNAQDINLADNNQVVQYSCPEAITHQGTESDLYFSSSEIIRTDLLSPYDTIACSYERSTSDYLLQVELRKPL